MNYTQKEILSMYYESGTTTSLNEFVKSLEKENSTESTTDPKKANGDTKKDTKVDPKSTVSNSVDGSLGQQNTSEYTVEQAASNYENRTGRKASSVMELEDQDFTPSVEGFGVLADDNKYFRAQRDKIKDRENYRKKLESKITAFAYDKMGATKESADYVKEKLLDYDKDTRKELDLMNRDKAFKLKNDALDQLSKDTYSNRATGDGLDDTLSELDVVGGVFSFKGRDYYRDLEATETIDLMNDVEDAVVDSLDKRSLQKLAGGLYTLQEKEQLINSVKIPLIKQKEKYLVDQINELTEETESKLGGYKKQLDRLDFLSKNLLRDKPKNSEGKYLLSPEDVELYESFQYSYDEIKNKMNSSIETYNEVKEESKNKLDTYAGELGVDLAKQTIGNNFELSDQADEFREKYAGDGFWNASVDILGGEVLQGTYKILKKGTVGAASWLMTSFGDLFTDQENYSSYDAFSDIINNWTDNTLVPQSTDVKFDITKEEGGFKEFDARSYAKLGFSMIPFTAYLISEARKGNFTGIKEAVGKSISNLGNKGKVLTQTSQKLKDNIIMADAAFRATVLDNHKQAESLGLNGLQASAYATSLSSAEALFASIMPDTQFLKGTSGRVIKDAFAGNLRLAATKEGVKTAAKEFSTNILKELAEEELTLGANILTDYSFGLALPKASDFLNQQIELTMGTLMLSGGLGSFGAKKTFSNQKLLFYNQISENIGSLDLHLRTMYDATKDDDTKEKIEDAIVYAQDIQKAVKSSPKNVTADQIELLVEKDKLIKEKQSIDPAFHSEINDKIDVIDGKIKESSIKRDIETKIDEDIKNVSKSAKSLGFNIDETRVYEDDADSSASDKFYEFLLKNKPDGVEQTPEQYAEENKNNLGGFVVDTAGKEILIINKAAALKNSVVTTGQHEFLHKFIRMNFGSNTESINKAASLIESVLENTSEGQAVEIKSRIQSYRKDFNNKKITADEFYEEFMPLLSEAITREDVKLNNSVLTKIKDYFRRLLQDAGFKRVDFTNSEDSVVNFIKDYNKAFQKGKFSSKLNIAGAVKNAEPSKKSKLSPSKGIDVVSDLKQQRDELDMFDFDDPNEFDSALANIERKIKIAEKKQKEVKKQTKVGGVETDVSDKNKKISDENKKIVDDMQSLGANKVSELDEVDRKKITKRLAENNKGLVEKLVKRATSVSLAGVDDSVRIGAEEFRSGYEANLAKLINSYDYVKNKSFGAYINEFLPKRYGEILKAAKKGKIEKTSSISDERVMEIAASESTGPKQEVRKKYVSLLNSNMVPSFTVKEITGKLLDKIGSLKSKITDATGANAASTPLIKEIRSKIAKVAGDKEAIPKLVRQRMGKSYKNGKETGIYENFLLKNKKAILQNLTTTYLMGKDKKTSVAGGVPIAIEKSVGGEYTGVFDVVNIAGIETKYEVFKPNYVPFPDWVGQKIDREGGAKRGSTSGNQLVRRISESKIENMSDEVFLNNFLIEGDNKKGQDIFESLSLALGEEVSFEIISKELKNPNSEISKVFESNQAALGVMLKDNIEQEFNRQAERGLVKFSKTSGAAKKVSEFLSIEGSKSVNAKKVARAAGFTKSSYEEFIARVGTRVIDRLKSITDIEISLQENELEYLEYSEQYEKAYSGIKFSTSKQEAYKNTLKKRRPNLDKNQIESSVQSVFDFAKNPNIPDKSKSKLEKLAFHYMANGFVILPEDGYKVIEAERIAAIKKIDPFSFKNPNELIEKYAGQVKKVRTNPDTVKEFTNKKEFNNGVVTYDVQDSKNGQLAVREVIDTNWGKKSNPWCLAARDSRVEQTMSEFFNKEEADKYIEELKAQGYEVEVGFIESEGRYEVYGDMMGEPDGVLELRDAFELWQSYNDKGNGFKISFKDGKLLSFRDGNKKQWWDRMDNPSNELVYEVKEKGFSVDGQKTAATYSVDANNGSRSLVNSIVGDKKSGNYTTTKNVITDSGSTNFSEQSVVEFKNGKPVNIKSIKTDDYSLGDNISVFQLTSGFNIKVKDATRKAQGILRNITYKYLEIPYGAKSVVDKGPAGRITIEKGNLDLFTEAAFGNDFKVFKDVTIFSETYQNNDSYKSLTIDGIDVLSGPKEVNLDKFLEAREKGATDTSVKFSNTLGDFKGNEEKLRSAAKRNISFAYISKAKRAKSKASDEDIKSVLEDFETKLGDLINTSSKDTTIDDIINESIQVLRKYISDRQFNNLKTDIQNKYLPVFNSSEFTIKSFERLLKNIIGSIEKMLDYHVKAIGIEESMATLKDRLKEVESKQAQIQLIKDYIRNESRSIRTFSYAGITTNMAFYNKLLEVVNLKDDYGFEVELIKDGLYKNNYRVFQDIEGKKEYISGYKTGTETKKGLGVDSVRATINEEAGYAREYVYTLLEYYRSKIDKIENTRDKKTAIDNAISHLKLLTEDQSGAIRKLSKAGFAVLDEKGRYLNTEQTTLEHSITVNDIFYEIKGYLNNKTKTLESLKDLLEEAYVNVVTKKQDNILTRQGLQRTGGKQRVFNTEFKKSVDELNKNGRVYGYGVVYGESIDKKQSAINNANKLSYSRNSKGISVWDFDDTLARTKSNVLYTMPDGSKGKLDAAQFAARSEALAEMGAEFDFSEFSKVMKGEKGPMFDKAIKRNKKFGNENVYVLTARPADSKFAIHKFLKGIGLDIKLDNIIGLADGNPQAKANWMITKVAEGYNDFYFADDHLGNVKAVKEVLDTFDVKGKVQQARVKFSASLDKTFNEIIQHDKGKEWFKEYSAVVAKRKGARAGRFKVWMPSSLDDFKGLTMYAFSGKGRQGEINQKFFQDSLLTPYWRGVQAINDKKQALKDDFKKLNKMYKPILKKLGKLIPSGDYTHDQAIRIYLWNKSGYEIPGISKKDKKNVLEFVNKNPELVQYAQMLQRISKRSDWTKPSAFWDAETILSDLNNITEKVGRKEYLQEFIENVDVIFSDKNLNKVEALYGTAHREALEDLIYRMKNGTNRPSGNNKNVNRFNNWINNSIGAIMFFNRRSALLQTLSTANFINWSDNNMLKAGAAFANQPQFWKDFAMIFNSSKLKQRRSGLKSDVNEAEIASAVKGSKNKAVAALSYLLKIGFTPTQMVDSFAIAAGGASFYRNRLNTYLKKVDADGEKMYTEKEAESKAWSDFSSIAEETQQSGDPALISSDQASTLGRLLLAFQNTPIQLNRSIKKAALDIKNRRRAPGLTMVQSDVSNISKIIYYGAIQNIIFSALQNALFALIPGFEYEDDELTEKEQMEKYGKVVTTKQGRIVNGISDTVLKGGFGVPGAFISTIKNVYLEKKRQEEKGFFADNAYVLLQAANLAPSVGSKLRKIYSGMQTEKFDKDMIEAREWDITINGRFNLSPNYKVLGAYVEGATNFPLDRITNDIESLTEALDSRNSAWQRIALALGWRTWDVGAKNEEHDLIKIEAKSKRKKEGIKKAKISRKEISSMKKTYKRNLLKIKQAEENISFNVRNNKNSSNFESINKTQVDAINKMYKTQDSIKDVMYEKDYKLEGNKFVKVK